MQSVATHADGPCIVLLEGTTELAEQVLHAWGEPAGRHLDFRRRDAEQALHLLVQRAPRQQTTDQMISA